MSGVCEKRRSRYVTFTNATFEKWQLTHLSKFDCSLTLSVPRHLPYPRRHVTPTRTGSNPTRLLLCLHNKRTICRPRRRRFLLDSPSSWPRLVSYLNPSSRPTPLPQRKTWNHCDLLVADDEASARRPSFRSLNPTRSLSAGMRCSRSLLKRKLARYVATNVASSR